MFYSTPQNLHRQLSVHVRPLELCSAFWYDRVLQSDRCTATHVLACIDASAWFATSHAIPLISELHLWQQKAQQLQGQG